MVNKPLVSIIMTCYNRERYIGKAIQSVLDSTYPDFELIIVDDQSADDTVLIAKSFEVKDSRIKIFINETNLGDYPNRNKAASYAKGKYIKYVDSDDCLYPHGLEVMVNCMERFPDAGFGLCSLTPDITQPFPFMLVSKEAYEYHFFGLGLFHKGPLSAIFLRTAFEMMGGFAEGRMISDIDMWHRMALQFPVVVMPGNLVWQRRHPEQELSDKQDFIYDSEKIKWKYLLDPLCKLSIEQIKRIKKMRLKRYAGFIISGLKNGNMKQVQTYFKCLSFVYRIKLPS